MDELEIFEYLEAGSQPNNRQLRHEVRERWDPFNLGEQEFVKEYRLTKQLALDLCHELRPKLKDKNFKATDLKVETKVLTALSFYANGSYQRPTGCIAGHFMAQQTVSTVIAEVTAAINSLEMRRKYIVFPQNYEERNKIKQEFYNKFGIPGVLGCIDCTHVAIVRPSQHEERYFSRKHYHSINVQLICDANMQITSVDASHGGATHDSFIWTYHPIKEHLENLSENTWLLGDSGYPLRRYLMTPIVDAPSDTPESYYTENHVKTRCIIERTIGLLKARFRCLLSHRVLHYRPDVAGNIINACVILHNICNKNNLPIYTSGETPQDPPTPELQPVPGTSRISGHPSDEFRLGEMTRRGLVARLWQMRER